MKIRLLIVILLSGFLCKSQVDHWETVVFAEDFWKYQVPSSEPPSDWRTLSYNDVSWNTGQLSIGYGDDDDNTLIPTASSVYLRLKFTITDTSKIDRAILHADYDDGFVAYINDVEIARSNIGSIGDHPAFNQYTSTDHEAVMYQGGVPENFNISKEELNDFLINGENILCIQVHNASPTSTDLTSLFFLSLGINDISSDYSPTPSWFVPPFDFVSSNLPIVTIDTYGQSIYNETRITAHLGIIYNGDGVINYLTDSLNNYNGNISIEIRGSSSAGFAKKSYAFETQDILGENNNVSLVDLPVENDWILYGPYSDKSLIRNALIYDLSNEMKHYASRTKFCELLINEEYRGIYILMEKIKRDNDRVKIKKLEPTDFHPDTITGGYILKIDKTTGSEFGGFYSEYTSYFSNEIIHFQYHYPKPTEITVAQEEYIQDFIRDFENSLASSDFSDPSIGYRRNIDVRSFIDFLILNEISKNVDGYRLSTFMYKNRDTHGGKLNMGPIWDFNLGFGNADYCEGYNTSGWAFNFNYYCSGDSKQIPFWWHKLLLDASFNNQLKCRWNELRSDILHTDSIHHQIDEYYNLLQEAYPRNFAQWPVLGVYLWPNYFVGNTYEEEINFLKDWITDRMNWLDNSIPGTGTECISNYSGDLIITEINYHSSSLDDAGDWFEVFNNGSTPIDISHWTLKDSDWFRAYYFPGETILEPGEYLVICEDTVKFKSVYPDVTNYIGQFNWAFGNEDDIITLWDEYEYKVTEVAYEDTLPWPYEADGLGYTLELDDYFGDQNDYNNWFAGCPGGSPGTEYIYPCDVGVESLISHDIIVYPNPWSLAVNIILPESEKEYNISITDLSGKKVYSTTTSSNKVTINRNNLRAGFYFLNIQSEINYTEKLIIQ